MLKTFAKGGVHPSENKITAQKSIVDLSLPATVTIPLAMHLGVPAKPIVEKGDAIKTGQLIAKGNGFVSARRYRSTAFQTACRVGIPRIR